VKRLPKSVLDKNEIPGWNTSGSFEFAHNKYKLLEAFKKFGLPVPETKIISSLGDLNDIQFNFPVIVKPVSSCVLVRGKLIQFAVKRIKSKVNLIDYAREIIESSSFMIQEIIHGYGVGFNILSQNGNIINYYSHRRIIEGHDAPSTFRGTAISENYFDISKLRKVVEYMGWNGVAMLEFKVQDGVPYIMEMNGRFWGSLEVGIKSGFNYPEFLIDLHFNNNSKQNPPYRDIQVRNLLSDTSLHLFELINSRNFKFFFAWFFSLPKYFFKSNHFIEDNILFDPKFRTLQWARFFWNFLKKFKRSGKLTVAEKTARPTFKESDGICFVCFGNICRSPFAEAYLKRYYPNNLVYSTGFFDLDKRLPPMNAVLAAQNFGVDLTEHYSTNIDTLKAVDIKAYFIMDNGNYENAKKYFSKDEMKKIYFLDTAHEIPDPYKKDLQYFKKIYSQIAESIDSLMQINTIQKAI
jgi:protein-tyrosine-phosphatase